MRGPGLRSHERAGTEATGEALLKPLKREAAVLPHHQLPVLASVRGQLRQGRLLDSENAAVMSVPYHERSSTRPSV
ncbi:hypothetical protein [Streptomyces flaveolus]|uniref:hypothetical protein n=1 Tax=Streptomyces flaveolus TaxID=67297 RepID=UPI0036F7B7A8